MKRVVRKTITRERRRLKKFRHLFDLGRMTFEQILNAYKSWKGSIKRRGMCYTSIMSLDKLFNGLFIDPFINGYDYYNTNTQYYDFHTYTVHTQYMFLFTLKPYIKNIIGKRRKVIWRTYFTKNLLKTHGIV